MPVVHGRNLSEIELSLDLLDRCASTPRWVGLGGVVPLLQNRRVSGLKAAPEIFIAQALTLIRAAYPASKIHVFGAGGTRTLPAVVALGADSADSIGWRQAAGYGSIFLPMKSQRTVRWNGEKRPPRKLLDKSDISQIESCRCPICIDQPIDKRIEAFRQYFHSRSIHNAWTILNQWESWPSSRLKLMALISNGLLGERWARAIT
jgi:queuine/archaeosine tRNA-ribosyltransferase